MKKEPTQSRKQLTSLEDIAPAMTEIEEKAKKRVDELESATLPPEPIRMEVAPLKPLAYRPTIEMYAGGHLPPVDEDADLEFVAVTVKFQEVPGPIARSTIIDATPAKTVEGFLNDGWQIDETISVPPFAMIVFSREREEEESDNADNA